MRFDRLHREYHRKDNLYVCIESLQKFNCEAVYSLGDDLCSFGSHRSVNADIRGSGAAPNRGRNHRCKKQTNVSGRQGRQPSSSAARLSYPTFFCGQVGQDGHAFLLKEALASAGVCLDHLTSVKRISTGHAVVMLQPGGQNSIIIVGGANVAWPKLEDGRFISSHVQELIERTDAVLLQREIPDAVNLEAIRIAVSADVTVIMDAGGAESPIPDELLKCVTVLSPNETELARLTAMPTNSLEEILQADAKVQETGVKHVLVKMEENGSVFVRDEEPPIFQPAILAPVGIDTTGAGDTFAAAFTVAIIECRTPANALRFAAVRQHLCVCRQKAQPQACPKGRQLKLSLLKQH